MQLITGATTVVLATLTGCATASSTTATPAGAKAPTTVSQSHSPSPAASSPTTAPTSVSTATYTFHGMKIQLQAGWKSGTVVREATGTVYHGIVTGGPCRNSNFGTDCPGFILLYQPDYQAGQPFTYGSGQYGCPQDRNLMQMWPSNGQPIISKVTVGGRTAYLTQDKVLCVSNDPNGGPTKTYIQYTWWVPSQQLLVVDDGWLVPGLGNVLTHATWATTSVPSIANYVGTWTRHTDTFVIKANGSGTETDGDGICPINPSWMCGFTATLAFTLTTNGLKATYTSVTPTVNGLPSSEYTLDPSEPRPNDSFVLVIGSHDRLRITDLSRSTRFNASPARRLLCGKHTPAVYACP